MGRWEPPSRWRCAEGMPRSGRAGSGRPLPHIGDWKTRGETLYGSPLWEKPYLTLEEAVAFFHIGIHRLRVLSNADDCDFVVWIGSKRLFKRKKFEKFVDSQFSL